MRMVDADEIKAEIQKICDNCWHPYRLGGCPEHCGINDAVKAIDSAQTVDAVPVVRCAVCRYFLCNMRGDGSLLNGVDEFECILGRGGYDPMDFCSEGERKDGEQHD